MDELLRTTSSLCATCKRSVAAHLWRSGGRVVMRKRCPQHGDEEVLVSSDAGWYAAMMAYAPALAAPADARPVAQGCPFDCGPCASHEQQALLPIVPITSACNLDCPICYTHNRNDGAFRMSEAQLRAVLGHLRKADPLRRIVNLTGGEPTQHPDFVRLVELCHAEGIHRITVSTHGLRFLKDEWLLERLARVEARVVLSFDSFDNAVNLQMLGGRFADAKLRVLALLQKHGIDTTLLPVLARGDNDHEAWRFVRLALDTDVIRSVELHTLTFTGQGGAHYDRRRRLTTYDVLAALETQSQRALRIADFAPAPVAHPLCYLVTYLLRLDDGRWLPFPRFMGVDDMRAMLAGSLYLEPTPAVERVLRDVIDRIWSGETACDDADAILATLRNLLTRMFAPGLSDARRLRVGELAAKAVYVHAHMDEENFDTERVKQCCVGIREPDGRNIPSCSYNVLYRDRDARFTATPAPPVRALGAGRAFPVPVVRAAADD